jgi:hypothetical protein
MDKYTYEWVVDRLGLIKHLGSYDKTISSRLHSAYESMKEAGNDFFSQCDIFGMNRCVHLASSIVLLCADSEILATLVREIKDEVDDNPNVKLFEGPDPTTVITIATLFYILKVYTIGRKLNDGEEMVPDLEREEICKRFNNVNWMIGPKAVRILGIM